MCSFRTMHGNMRKCKNANLKKTLCIRPKTYVEMKLLDCIVRLSFRRKREGLY